MLNGIQSEVTDINKQKFLAELGKLLTFMYDEDRQDALAMYARMFDSAPDEQALIQFLVSPTRQAVVIARAYNARERKLQVNTTTRDGHYDEDEGTPDYARAIGELENEALSRKIIVPDVPENQFTLFADGIHPVEPAADETDEAEKPAAEKLAEKPVEKPAAEKKAAEKPAAKKVAAEAPAAAPAPRVTEKENEPEKVTVVAAAAEVRKMKLDDLDLDSIDIDSIELDDLDLDGIDLDGTELDGAEINGAKLNDAELKELEVKGMTDAVDAFISDFSVAEDGSDDGSKAADEPPTEEEQTPVRVMPDASGSEPEFVFDAGEGNAPRQTPPRPKKPAANNSAPAVELTERRANIPLLILYIIIAVPLVTLCVMVLLAPTLFFLAMSVGAVVLGCMALSSAFGAFTIFADVMVVLGTALVVLALGLLFLWIFVWFVGGAIAGLINGVIKLGGKWCFKEVSAT